MSTGPSRPDGHPAARRVVLYWDHGQDQTSWTVAFIAGPGPGRSIVQRFRDYDYTAAASRARAIAAERGCPAYLSDKGRHWRL